MSTRSMIAKQIGEDEYMAIYCHNEGYLSHNGALLLDFYNTSEKLDELLILGDISFLGKHLKPDPQKSYADRFEQSADNVTVAYARDIGEEINPAGRYSLKELTQSEGVFFYIFNLNHEWEYIHSKDIDTVHNLREDLEKECAAKGITNPEAYYETLNQNIADCTGSNQDMTM